MIFLTAPFEIRESYSTTFVEGRNHVKPEDLIICQINAHSIRNKVLGGEVLVLVTKMSKRNFSNVNI